MNKTCVINDPLGQTHSLASSDHYFLLFCCARFEKWGRTYGQHVRKQWSLQAVTLGWPSGSKPYLRHQRCLRIERRVQFRSWWIYNWSFSCRCRCSLWASKCLVANPSCLTGPSTRNLWPFQSEFDPLGSPGHLVLLLMLEVRRRIKLNESHSSLSVLAYSEIEKRMIQV